VVGTKAGQRVIRIANGASNLLQLPPSRFAFGLGGSAVAQMPMRSDSRETWRDDTSNCPLCITYFKYLRHRPYGCQHHLGLRQTPGKLGGHVRQFDVSRAPRVSDIMKLLIISCVCLEHGSTRPSSGTVSCLSRYFGEDGIHPG